MRTRISFTPNQVALGKIFDFDDGRHLRIVHLNEIRKSFLSFLGHPIRDRRLPFKTNLRTGCSDNFANRRSDMPDLPVLAKMEFDKENGYRRPDLMPAPSGG
jgi:hypothetical protein